MRMLLVVILCVLVNVLSKYLIKVIGEFINAIKMKKTLNNLDINQLVDLDNQFWNDLDKEDIDIDEK